MGGGNFALDEQVQRLMDLATFLPARASTERRDGGILCVTGGHGSQRSGRILASVPVEPSSPHFSSAIQSLTLHDIHLPHLRNAQSLKFPATIPRPPALHTYPPLLLIALVIRLQLESTDGASAVQLQPLPDAFCSDDRVRERVIGHHPRLS